MVGLDHALANALNEDDVDDDQWDPLPEDLALAAVEVRRRIAAAGGQEPLVVPVYMHIT